MNYFGVQGYAAAFFMIPAVRWVWNKIRNEKIEGRNDARRSALGLQGTPRLRQKQQSAARQAELNVIRDRDIVYRSDRAVSEQERDWEKEQFDRRLRE